MLNTNGLSKEEVIKSRKKYGTNTLTSKKKKSFLMQFVETLGDPIIKILLTALIIKTIFLFKDFDWFETLGILIAVFLSSLISTISEYGSEKAFEHLQEESSRIKCKVKRDGKLIETSIDEIVVGDIVKLETGDKIPADGIIIDGELSVDESSLNGETKEAYKYKVEGFPTEKNKVYRGCVVYSKMALMKVEKVGNDTFYGKLALEIQEDNPDSPLKLRLRKLAQIISRIGYIGAFLVAISYLFSSIVIENNFDIKKIQERLKKQDVKLVEIQRSRGYSTRKSLTIEKIEKVIKAIREVNKDVIIMVDNCYGEFVQDREPIEVGADIAVGSLMKNLGAGIATSGAYIVGKRELIELCAERLTSPGIGKEIGPSLNQNTLLLKGLFFAPSVVASSIKTAVFASRILEELGYQVEPKFDEERADIVQTIALGTEEKLVKFCQGIQMGSPIDSKVIPYPGDMGGYEDKVIMAAGTFTQGSTIELSCDGPIRPPYIAYMQGGLTYEYGKMGILKAIEYMEK